MKIVLLKNSEVDEPGLFNRLEVVPENPFDLELLRRFEGKDFTFHMEYEEKYPEQFYGYISPK